MMNERKKALICIDFINEIISPSGKLSRKGYYDFIQTHDTLNRVARAQRMMRSKGHMVIHVRLEFSESYVEHPSHSPLLGGVKQFGALRRNTWGTEFAKEVSPVQGDPVLTKNRVSAFYETGLENVLRAQEINEIFLAGVATDLAVESTARDAHDRDYVVTVLGDCCAAASQEDHLNSLRVLKKIATVQDFEAENSR